MFAPGNPANNLFRNSRLLALDGYLLLQQVSLMNTGVLDKIEETPVINFLKKKLEVIYNQTLFP
jgi:hypothetical protein